MDVRCERCRAHYLFDDDQVTEAGITVQCTKCGHLFRVKKKALVVTVPLKPEEVGNTVPILADQAARPAAAAPPAPEKPREWRVRQANGNVIAFKELTTLQKWIVERKVGRDDEISLSGEQWKRLGAIAELASFFQVVEQAERTRTAAPVVTPVPFQAPVFSPPAHNAHVPSGFSPSAVSAPPAPPASFTAEHAEPAWQPEPPAPPPSDEPAWTEGPPVAEEIEVDFHTDELRIPRRHGSGRMVALLFLLVLAGGAAAVYFFAPELVGLGPSAAPSPVAPVQAPPRSDAKTPATPAGAAHPAPAPPPARAEAPPAAPAPAAPPAPAAAPVEPPAPAPAAAAPSAPAAAPVEPAAPPPVAPIPEAERAEPRPAVAVVPAPRAPTAAKRPAPAASEPEPKSVRGLLLQAKRLRNRGQSSKALDLYGRVLAQEPENAEALAGRGWCYLDLSQYSPAEESFQQALERSPRHAEGLMGLAETFRYEGRRTEAIRYYELYLAAHPEGDDAVAARNALTQLKE